MKTFRSIKSVSASRITGNWFRPRIGATALIAVLACAPLARASTYTWNVVSGNWSSAASWNPNSPAGGPTSVDSAVFNNTDTSASSNTVNNTVDLGFAGAIANLSYTNAATTPAFQVTQIPAGETLIVTNNVLVGGNSQATAYITYAYLTGSGTFKVTGPNLTVQNYGSAAGANATAYFNLLGLSNFIYFNTNGIISVGNNPGAFTRLGGNLILAGGSNNITATNINIGTSTSAQAGPLCTLALGTGTNIINTAAINIANQKNSANVTFADGSAGGLKFRGLGGLTSRGNIILGNRNVGNGTGTTLGQLILTGHPVDILGGTVIIGEVPGTAGPLSGSNGGQFGNGLLAFDSGVLDITNLIMALNNAPNANGGVSGTYATLIVGPNATLRNSGGLALVDQTASNVCSSTLIVSNGVLACNGSITAITNIVAGTGAAASTNSIIFTNGGTILMGTGASIGTPANPIGTLAIAPATTISFATPPSGEPAIAVDSLVWPAVDTGVAFVISNLPPTATVGTVIPIVQYGVLSGGAITAPQVILPSGVTGTVSTSANMLSVTINSSIYPAITAITNGYVTLSTNAAITTVGTSTVTTITNVTVVTTTTTLGGLTNTVTTNTLSSPSVQVSGINTPTAQISFSPATNTIYLAVTITITDGNGRSVSIPAQPFDTIVPSLVIEGSDFNYSSGQFIDTPANGGLALYTNQIGTAQIDESKGTRTAPKSYYRPSDAVIIQTATPGLNVPPSFTEQKFVTAANNGDTNDTEQEVGYNTPGDWLNYSRSFGSNVTNSAPAGTYNVWCYLSTSSTGIQSGFYQVTSDPTQSGQTTNFIGTFGTASFSDNNYNNYVYTPLVDQYGNRIPLTISNGIQTFRNVVVGNPNIAFYLFVPVAPILTPTVLHVSPDGSQPFQSASTFTFTVGPENGALISTNGIGLSINGTSVTGLTFIAQGNNWIVNYSVPSNGVYTAVISVTNQSGLYTVTPVKPFDTFDINNYQWEAVDYDFSTNNGTSWVGGQFIDNPVPTGDTADIYSPPQTGTTATNSYYAYPTGFTPFNDSLTGLGAVAQQGIDYFTNTQTSVQTFYRDDTVGSQQCGDWVRPKFYLSQTNFNDFTICPFNIGYFNAGNWLNYTRTYPTNTFYVWGRLAGGAGSFSGSTLSLVTSGVGTTNQTTQVLGSFADPAPSGWQVYHWIPLLDGNGNKVVVSLGGQQTLRLTSAGGLNAEFLMLAPAVLPANFSIAATLSGNNIQISVPTQNTHTYTVYYSPTLPATGWSQVGSVLTGDGTVQTVTQSLTGSQGFYRVLAQ